MSFRKLFQLSLIGAALLFATAANGQGLQGICQANVKVNSVKYLGRQPVGGLPGTGPDNGNF